MLTQDIAAALRAGPPEDPAHLVNVYVESDLLGAAAHDARPEDELFASLLGSSAERPAHLFVRGKAGSGKTSMILRALSHIERIEPPTQTLLLRCGEKPDGLATADAFAAFMAEVLLEREGFRPVVSQPLMVAAATDVTTTPGNATMSAGAGGGAVPVNAHYDWKDPTHALKQFPTSERRAVLTDAIAQAAEVDRLVVVIDDTDHFAARGPNGSLDAESVSNLFENGIDLLLGMPVAIVAAVHPAYDDVAAVRRIEERGEFATVHVPELPVSSADPNGLPLAVILDRRLEVAGHLQQAGEIFDARALAQLQASYFQAAKHDLRRVLRLCGRSADLALASHSAVVELTHVQTALEEQAD